MPLLINQNIEEIVKLDYNYASVLYNLGIKFYDYPHNTLREVCQKQGLRVEQVIKNLESIHRKDTQNLTFQSYPIEVVIQYLKHSHHIFIHKKLPFVSKLIEDLTESGIRQSQVIKDLQILFPLFVEDFIVHIHEEEDTLFHHIENLLLVTQNKYSLNRIYSEIEKHSIQFFALDHHSHDDEMRGIREITNNYSLLDKNDLHLRVIFEELKALEKELIIHAKIEDEILFIKALHLESQVKQLIKKNQRLN